MTAPAEYKSIKVSPETHRLIHDLAVKLGGSADTALAHLLSDSTVRVPVSTVQHDRWNAAARAAGIELAEFVRARVEAALSYGTDPYTMALIYQDLRALCRKNGVTPSAYTPPALPSTQGRTPS